MTRIQALEPEQARQGELRIVVGDGDADLGVGRGEPALGRDDVRPTPEHVDRIRSVLDTRDDWNWSDGRQLVGVSAGLGTHENIEPVQLGFKIDPKWRNACACLGKQRLGLRLLAIRSRPAHTALAHDVHEMLVRGNLVGRDGKPGLVPANPEIRIRSVRRDRNSGPHLRGLSRFRFGRRRLRVTPQAAEQVDFPTGADADVIERLVPVIARQVVSNCAGGTVERLMDRACRSV